jgi:hypothetical protein
LNKKEKPAPSDDAFNLDDMDDDDEPPPHHDLDADEPDDD